MLKRYIPILTCLLLLCASAPADAQLFKGGLLKKPIVQQILHTPITLANTPLGNVTVTPSDFLKARDSVNNSGTIMVDPVVRTNLNDTETNLKSAAKITDALHAKYFDKPGTPKVDPKTDKDGTKKKKKAADLSTTPVPLKKG